MRYPRGTEGQRASMWLEHTRRRGWKAVAAVEVADRAEAAVEVADRAEAASAEAPTADQLGEGALLGVAYGYSGAPDQWWQQQVSQGLHRVGVPREEIARLMSSYFELTELHIHPRAQGRGLGEALARRLLADRGGCTGGWASPTSSGATTSPAIPGPSRSSAARCRSDGLLALAPPGTRVWHDTPRA
jgi:ribosomal protein S18 acetylase RimI-like enzyme